MRERLPSDPWDQEPDDFAVSCPRAEIIDVQQDKGTCAIRFEATMGERRNVTIPLVYLSYNNREPYKSAWIRFMPQIGDIVLVNFDPNGTPYIVGYSCIDYETLQKIKSADQPGFVFRSLKPGEIEVRSAGMAGFFASRGATFTTFAQDQTHILNGNTREEIANIGLYKLQSDNMLIRIGDAKRKSYPPLPTDINETIVGTILALKEVLFHVSQTVGIIERNVVDWSVGNVIEEPTLLDKAKEKVSSFSGDPVRHWLKVYDSTTGLISMFESELDAKGNYALTFGPAALKGVQIDATVSPFTISNKQLSWSCLTGISFDTVAGGVSLSATAGNVSLSTKAGNAELSTAAGIAKLATALGMANVDGTTVHLGPLPAAVQPIILGLAYTTAEKLFLDKLTQFFAALGIVVAALVPTTGVAPGVQATFVDKLANALAAITTFQGLLIPGTTLSLKSFTA